MDLAAEVAEVDLVVEGEGVGSMWILLVLLGLISMLQFFRTQIQRSIQAMAMLLGGDHYTGIVLYSMLFLPGVVIHEMSHFFAATLLGVRTGDITIFPRRDSEDDGRIALGTVKVEKTDFVRSSLIGVAPFVTGSIALFALVSIMFDPIIGQFEWTSVSQLIGVGQQLLASPKNILFFYLVFAISNTMFVSKEDARAFPVIAFFLILIGGVMLATGTAQHVGMVVWPRVEPQVIILTASFMAALIIDLVVVLVLRMMVFIMQKVVRKRVVYGKG